MPGVRPGAAVTGWHDSRYTGLFTRFGALDPRPHAPDVPLFSGLLPPWGPLDREIEVGGAGWDGEAAEAACVGEGIERAQSYPLPRDGSIEASADGWPLDEPPVEPSSWALFHPGQHAAPGFPFEPFTRATRCRWTCFRDAITGAARWVPEEFTHLHVRAGARHRICPATSTGLACGRAGMPVLLRGLQEVVERDAAMGAWWGRYPLEEWPAVSIWARLSAKLRDRVVRPNLRYRFWRVETPFSAHVTWVTVEGEDHEGFCFAAGSACRETRDESWRKSLLEAIHGFRYAGHLRARLPAGEIETLAGFAHHAVFYSVHPERLAGTALARAVAPAGGGEPREGLPELAARLSPRPVLFRNVTPPAVATGPGDWFVLRVVVPGPQPMHGVHSMAHLGGALWAPRGPGEWASMPPHPFP